MTKYGWSVEEDTFTDNTPFGPKRFTNIVATHNPKAPRRLVLSCHFDSKYFADIEFIGATDSAVPCAMLLDIARHLNTSLWTRGRPTEEDLSLQLVFFDGEEAFVDWTPTDSIYGARHLAEKWSTSRCRVGREEWAHQLETVDVLVLLDLIGTKDPEFHSWFKNTEHLFERFQKIEMRLIKLGLLEHIDTALARNKYFTSRISYNGGGIEDDHIPFLSKNVPVLHMIAYPFPREWHKASDDKNALHFSTIDNINKILRVFVCEYLHLTP
ncbi:Glutaminyl-peptide cyclotransferase [Lamellibrachia satsuma]|nr:Glutaminyl-peptide cyclotransferase [Lamellibrachia satsuma]